MMAAGTPLLSILIIGIIGFSVYRFWVVGWPAWTGNLRLAAVCAFVLGMTGLLFAPLWTFGIRNRRIALVVAVVGVIAFLIFNKL